MVEPLQAVQVVQVPLDRGFFAVDLESVERLVAAGVASALEQAEGAVAEVAEERAGVVDAHLLDFACEVVLPLFNKGLSHRRDIADATIEPECRIDAVR